MVQRHRPRRRAPPRRHPRRGDTNGSAARRTGRRPRRMADARRHQRLEGHPHRSGHRGCAHANAPLRCRSDQRLGGRFRRVSRTQSRRRRGFGLHTRRARRIASRAAHHRDVGHARRRGGRATARRRTDHRVHPPPVSDRDELRRFDVRIVRCRPRCPGHAASVARGRRQRARVRAGRVRDRQGRAVIAARASRHRRRRDSPAPRLAQTGRAGPCARAIAVTASGDRCHLDRRDQPHHRRRRCSGRQRVRPHFAFRPAPRHGWVDDGPGVARGSRPAQRTSRAHRAGSLLSPLVRARARAAEGTDRTRDRAR